MALILLNKLYINETSDSLFNKQVTNLHICKSSLLITNFEEIEFSISINNI